MRSCKPASLPEAFSEGPPDDQSHRIKCSSSGVPCAQLMDRVAKSNSPPIPRDQLMGMANQQEVST